MNFNLENYRNYSLEDWIMDPDFQSYALQNDLNSFEDWDKFFEDNPELKPLADTAKGILVEMNQPSFTLEKEEVKDLWFLIQRQERQKEVGLASNWYKSSLFKAGVAACLIVALASVLFWSFLPSKSIEYSTGYGESIHLFLPDSSEVTLNSNSKLVYSGNWEKAKRREVFLTGEAFFKVRHLKDHRSFAVIPNDGIEIEVLGTSFNVYERRDETRIILSEGKVELKFPRSAQDNIEMKPGDLIAVSNEKISRRQVDASLYTSWTQKVLFLDKTSLKEIIKIAEENYGLTVMIDSKVDLDQTASGSVPLSEADQFMRLIAKVFNLQLEEKNSIYYVQ